MGGINITVTGLFPLSDLYLLREVFNFKELDDKEIVVYCLYSEMDIPVGTIFSMIENIEGDIIFLGEITLMGVTQQFLKPFNYIPKGWKTICKLQFKERVPLVLTNLSEVKWDDAMSRLKIK